MKIKNVKKGPIILLILVTVLLAYPLIEPYLIETKEVTITSKDIPKSFDGKRIIFISDIHYGEFFSETRVKSLVDRINTLEPDMVLFGGDYVDKDTGNISPCFAELKNLKAPLGKYGVLGNHDYWGRENMTLQEMNDAGIIPLDNQAVWVTSGTGRIRLGGVGDLWHDSPSYNKTIEGVNASDYAIMLSHNPDYSEKIRTDKIDLVLSGHTHGGQVTFFGLWAPFTNSRYGQKYRAGLVENAHTEVYVTRGIGTTILPIRFFSRPEITLITLKKP